MAHQKHVELADVIDAICRLAKEADSNAGREAVPEPISVIQGADSSRRLDLDIAHSEVTEDEAHFVLSAAGSEVSLRLRRSGTFLVSFGVATFEAVTRAAGSGFVDELSSWLRTPLGPSAHAASQSDPPTPLQGGFVLLDTHVDAEGAHWRRFKVCIAKDADDDESEAVGEFFMSLCDDNRRAWLSEKSSDYREPLLRAFDDAMGDRREILPRKNVAVIGGGAWFSVPPDWIVSTPAARKKSAVVGDIFHTLVTNASGSCNLQALCLPLPRRAPRLPSLCGRLEYVLQNSGQEESISRIVEVNRRDIDVAWIEYPYTRTDETGGDPTREARARILFAANDHLQIFTTFTFWPEDASWAIPEWRRIVDSLTLGHWEHAKHSDAAQVKRFKRG